MVVKIKRKLQLKLSRIKIALSQGEMVSSFTHSHFLHRPKPMMMFGHLRHWAKI